MEYASNVPKDIILMLKESAVRLNLNAEFSIDKLEFVRDAIKVITLSTVFVL
jgi:hypothetical protein